MSFALVVVAGCTRAVAESALPRNGRLLVVSARDWGSAMETPGGVLLVIADGVRSGPDVVMLEGFDRVRDHPSWVSIDRNATIQGNGRHHKPDTELRFESSRRDPGVAPAMGLDVSTDLICGALVDLERELFVHGESVPYRCEKCLRCHESGMKFCGECGLRFTPVKVKKWGPRAMAYFVKRSVFIPEDDVDLREGESGPFFNVAAPRSSEDGSRAVWAIGVELPKARIDMDDQHSWPRAVSLEAIRKAAEKVESMLQDLELPQRDIAVFPRMYISV